MKHWRERTRHIAAFWMLLLTLGWGQPRLELKVQPLFGALSAEQGCLPLLIALENRGASVKGVVAVEVGDFGRNRRYLYPIELPSGARKEVIAYPAIEAYIYQLVVRFETPRPLAIIEVPVNQQGSNTRIVAGVTDEIGGLGFLRNVELKAPNIPDIRYGGRSRSHSEKVSYQAVFCRPDYFPVRASACSGLSAILIGPGAERLTEAQWRSLRLWVSTGGTLIVPGGSGAIYLQTPILQSMLPVQNPSTTQAVHLAAVGRFSGKPPPNGSAVITEASPKPGARVWLKQDGIPLIAGQSYGLGMVVFLAYNPWDQPMRSYPAHAEVWKKFLAASPVVTPAVLQYNVFNVQSGDVYEDPWMPRTMRRSSIENRSFQVPAAGTVLAILLLYFLFVVPVNFLVLKRFRALDWTWLTVPAIALVFVFLLYRVGSGLYKQGQVSDTKASVLMAAGSPEAYVYASTLFFFPRAGSYNIQFQNAELVESGLQNDYRGMQGTSSLNTVEGNPILAENYRVRNLSFQWFRYTRFIELPAVIDGNLKAARSAGAVVRIEGTITNRLPYHLKDAVLLTPSGESKIEAFEPGQSRQVRITISSRQTRPEANVLSGFGDTNYSYDPDPIMQVGLKTRNWNDMHFVVLKASAEEPNVTPVLDVSGSVKQEVTYYCVIPVQVEGE